MTDRKSNKPFLRPLLLVATTNAFDECFLIIGAAGGPAARVLLMLVIVVARRD
jgi:hypothetical protein